MFKKRMEIIPDKSYTSVARKLIKNQIDESNAQVFLSRRPCLGNGRLAAGKHAQPECEGSGERKTGSTGPVRRTGWGGGNRQGPGGSVWEYSRKNDHHRRALAQSRTHRHMGATGLQDTCRKAEPGPPCERNKRCFINWMIRFVSEAMRRSGSVVGHGYFMAELPQSALDRRGDIDFIFCY